MEIIRKSEEVAPGATQAGSLRSVLATSREHEIQRIAIDKALIEIEVALHKESLEAAQAKIKDALKKFPGDDKLQELSTIAHDSFLLSGGRVVAAGTPDELHKSPVAEVQQFMGGLADGPVPFHYPASDYQQQLLEEEA